MELALKSFRPSVVRLDRQTSDAVNDGEKMPWGSRGVLAAEAALDASQMEVWLRCAYV